MSVVSAALSLSRKHLPVLAVLLLVFALSVWARWSVMDRPLSHAFEWLTAHTLVVHDSWRSNGGMVANLFAQNMSYGRDQDKYINNASQSNHHADYPIGPNGNYFYLSHPSLGVVAPYVTLAALGLASKPLTLQCFNLLVQLVCALILYSLVCRVLPPGWPARLSAFTAAAAYIWLPSNLWFHSNVYFVEIFLQLPFLLSAWLFIRYLDSDRHRGWLLALAAAVFAATLTEWTGVLLGGSLFLWALLRSSTQRDWALAMAAAAAAALALLIFVIQGVAVVGFDEFVDHLYRQFLFRSYPDQQATYWERAELPRILNNYRLGIVPAGFLLLGLGAAVIAVKSDWRIIKKTLPLFYVLVVPVALHHIILSGYNSTHWFAVLKTTPAICVLIAALVHMLLIRPQRSALFVPVLCVALVLLGYTSYKLYRTNYVDNWGDPRHYNVMGSVIRKLAEPDDIVFLMTNKHIEPQLVYYAKKNMVAVPSEVNARRWLEDHGKTDQNAILFLDIGTQDFVRIPAQRNQ